MELHEARVPVGALPMSAADSVTVTAETLFAGPGEMRARCRAHDWGATALGPVESWPPSLRVLAPLVLAAGVPSAIFWGPELTLIYNDAYIPLMGALHPVVLGRPHFDVVPESRAMFEPLFARVRSGETVSLGDVPTTFRRDALDGPLTTSFYTFSFAPVREVDDPAGPVIGIHGITLETTAEAKLRATEARKTFLLTLSDALRPLVDPVEIQGEAARLLGEQLGADRVLYAETEEDTIVVHRDWVRGIASMAGRYPASVWGEYIAVYLRGEAYVVHDVACDPKVDDTAIASYRGVDVAAFIGLGLVKGGAHVASFGVHSRTPRAWTAEEVELVRETAERTWAAVERARAELALRESEAKYRTIFDSIDEGFATHEVLYDDAGRPADMLYLEINPAFERHTGVSGCVGRTVREILPTIEDAWIEKYARVARTGEPLRFEQHNESTGRWYSSYLSRVGHDGSPLVASVFNDITERKRAEATLTAAAARDAFLVRLADALRPLADAVAVQAEAMRVLGEHFGAVRAQLWEAEPDGRHLVSEGGYARGLAPLAMRIRPEDYGVEVSAIFRAGRTLAVADTAAHPLVGGAELAAYRTVGIGSFVGVPLVKDGQWVAVLGLHREEAYDWTPAEIALVEEVAERTWAAVERARAEAARHESEVRLQQAVAATGLGVFDWDVATDRLSVNAHFRAMFGLPPEEQILVGAMMTAQVHPDDRAPVEAQIAAAFHPDSSGSYEVEHRATTPRGLRWFRASGQVNVEGEARHPVRLVGVIQDITERRVADDALRASLESAETANRAKSEFLAVMSHELRTPLNAIGGYAELLEMGIRGPVTPQQREDLARIQMSQRHLLGLINDVLNYAKLETGTVHYAMADVRAWDALAAAEGLVAPQARAKGLALSVSRCADDVVVRADADKLRQVLVNLLSNAVKFTDRGGRIELTCDVSHSGSSGTDVSHDNGARSGGVPLLVRYTVRDTGIGIAAHQLERIFEPFVQVHSDLTRTAEGTGLGLAISRDLARGMGGDLTAESEVGVGSTFTLTLPAAGFSDLGAGPMGAR